MGLFSIGLAPAIMIVAGALGSLLSSVAVFVLTVSPHRE